MTLELTQVLIETDDAVILEAYDGDRLIIFFLPHQVLARNFVRPHQTIIQGVKAKWEEVEALCRRAYALSRRRTDSMRIVITADHPACGRPLASRLSLWSGLAILRKLCKV
jgi:hypothetical protein